MIKLPILCIPQCQKLLWKAALGHRHLQVPDQKTPEHRAVLLTHHVQVLRGLTLTPIFFSSPILHLNSVQFPCSLGMQCIPQRAALLKSMLNFLKKAIQDPAFSDGIRHGESLQSSNQLVQNNWRPVFVCTSRFKSSTHCS